MLNTIASSSKWIVIASASRATNSASLNMMETASAFNSLSTLKGIKALGLVTGYYRESTQSVASYEQSLVFGVSQTGTLKAVIDLFSGRYEQDCILVWNTDSNQVWLVNKADGMFQRLGCKGLTISTNPEDIETAYTRDGQGNYWVVA